MVTWAAALRFSMWAAHLSANGQVAQTRTAHLSANGQVDLPREKLLKSPQSAIH